MSDDTPSRLSALEIRMDHVEQHNRDLLRELRSINECLHAMQDVFARKSGVVTGMLLAASAIAGVIGFAVTGAINWFR